MQTICINSQSSPIRLLRELPKSNGSFCVRLDDLVENLDYKYNAGGVTRMVDPMVNYGVRTGHFSNVDWIALSGSEDYQIDMGDYTLHGISLPPRMLRKYADYKEAIWDSMHGRKVRFTRSGFRAYMDYNRKVAEKIKELNRNKEYDLFYIHDFQQLPQGKLLGDFAPQLFRWHIPLRADFCSDIVRDNLIGFLNEYTAVVVSTERYANELRKMGFLGHLIHSYPYVDEEALKSHNNNRLSEFKERWGLSDSDRIVLCVARRTPSKNQSILIRAMKTVSKACPKAKLILVGNGSFSNSAKGGLGLSKSEKWANHLSSLISSMNLENNVIMTGYLDTEQIQMAYQSSDLLVLPSLFEGFGLVAIEAWFYQKPVIVSKEAGVAERVAEGENGYTFDPRKPRELADKILTILRNPTLAEEMGRNGYDIAQKHALDEGLKSEIAMTQETIELWQTERAFGTFIDFAET